MKKILSTIVLLLLAVVTLTACTNKQGSNKDKLRVADFLAKKGNYENSKLNLLSYMIFSLGNLAPIITMWLAPKAYIAQLLAKGKTQDYVNQVMVPFTASHVLILIGGTLMAALIGGYIAQNWLKK